MAMGTRTRTKRRGERVYGADGGACRYRSEKKSIKVITAAMIMASSCVTVQTWLGKMNIPTSDLLEHKPNADLVVEIVK